MRQEGNIELKTIWKFKLGTMGQSIRYSAPFVKILCIQAQNGEPMVWVEVDENLPERLWQFDCVGTGWDFISNGVYVGTAQDGNGYVWHYYMSEVV